MQLYLSPSVALATFVYHSTLLLLKRKRPDLEGMISVPAIAAAYVLSLAWLVAFIVMVLIAYGHEAEIELFWIHANFPDGEITTQRLQLLFTSLEFSILGDFAIRSTILRRHARRMASVYY